MSYQVIFVNGEKRELSVKADKVHVDPETSTVMTFKNNDGRIVALVPVKRILYVTKAD